MIDTRKFLEGYLQKYRFRIARGYIRGDVLDFGGNEGELRPFVDGEYTFVNYDHAPMQGKTFDTIVSLAVIEHIPVAEVYTLFRKFREHLRDGGTIFMTTPTPASKPLLEILAFIHLLDRDNIREHKHYWNRKELYALAADAGFEVTRYGKFQGGFNQYIVITPNPKSLH